MKHSWFFFISNHPVNDLAKTEGTEQIKKLAKSSVLAKREDVSQPRQSSKDKDYFHEL